MQKCPDKTILILHPYLVKFSILCFLHWEVVNGERFHHPLNHLKRYSSILVNDHSLLNKQSYVQYYTLCMHKKFFPVLHSNLVKSNIFQYLHLTVDSLYYAIHLFASNHENLKSQMHTSVWKNKSKILKSARCISRYFYVDINSSRFIRNLQ